MKHLWNYIQSSWQTRAGFVFSILWFWFVIMAVLASSPSLLYTYAYGTKDVAGVISVISESELFWYMLGILTGIVGYIIGLVWVLKKCARVYTKCHWVDLIIKIFGYGIALFMIMCVAVLLLWLTCVEFPIAAVVFANMCVISLVVAFIISRMFIRESLITEANVKARELYSGKKRFTGK